MFHLIYVTYRNLIKFHIGMYFYNICKGISIQRHTINVENIHLKILELYQMQYILHILERLQNLKLDVYSV